MEVKEGSSLAEEIGKEIAAEPPEPSEPAGSSEPSGEVPGTGAEAPPRPRYIPLHVAKAQRTEIEELKRELSELRKLAAPKDPDPPDPVVDPVGRLKWMTERQEKDAKEREERESSWQQEQQFEAQTQEIVDHYAEACDYYSEAVPDFDDAYKFALKVVMDDLRLRQGIRNPRMRDNIQKSLEYQFVHQAISQGINPAEAIYNKAIEFGYQPPGAVSGNGAENPYHAEAPQQQFSRDARTGQFTAPKPVPAPRSLSQAKGTPGRTINEESILNMSNTDFDKFVANGGWEELGRRR